MDKDDEKYSNNYYTVETDKLTAISYSKLFKHDFNLYARACKTPSTQYVTIFNDIARKHDAVILGHAVLDASKQDGENRTRIVRAAGSLIVEIKS